MNHSKIIFYNTASNLVIFDFIMINQQTHYKYSHDRLEIKDLRCIHQGLEREKKGWQSFCFTEYFDIKLEEADQLMYHLKISPYSMCIILIIYIHIICMILT